MLDALARRLIDPPLNRIGILLGPRIHANTVTLLGFVFGILSALSIAIPNAAVNAVAWSNLPLLFLVLNRLCDGIDGAVARFAGVTAFGGFLDIVCDFLVYSSIPFAFGVRALLEAEQTGADPGSTSSFLVEMRRERESPPIGSLAQFALSFYVFPALFLVFSFVGPITSFLAYAILDAKRSSEKAGEEDHDGGQGEPRFDKAVKTASGLKSFYYVGGLCEGTETFVALALMCVKPSWFREICYVYGVMCFITTIGRIGIAWWEFGGKKEISASPHGKKEE